MNDAMEYFTDHPAYVVIYGLGGLCLLLVIVAVVIIVTSPARRYVNKPLGRMLSLKIVITKTYS